MPKSEKVGKKYGNSNSDSRTVFILQMSRTKLKTGTKLSIGFNFICRKPLLC